MPAAVLAQAAPKGFCLHPSDSGESAMDTITIKAKGISVSLDLTVGHIADMTVESGGRRLKPLHRAPWVDANETLPKDLQVIA